MNQVKVGLLPLYLELYDKTSPQNRKDVEVFAGDIAARLESRGLQVTAAPVCRLKEEFTLAGRLFEEKDVAAVITLHLAYSPSLESADMLAGLKVPVLVLDTTPDFCFLPDGRAITSNHGIHGVQDMCNLLRRNGKSFFIGKTILRSVRF